MRVPLSLCMPPSISNVMVIISSPSSSIATAPFSTYLSISIVGGVGLSTYVPRG